MVTVFVQYFPSVLGVWNRNMGNCKQTDILLLLCRNKMIKSTHNDYRDTAIGKSKLGGEASDSCGNKKKMRVIRLNILNLQRQA